MVGKLFSASAAAAFLVLTLTACATNAPFGQAQKSAVAPASIQPAELRKIADVYLKDILKGLETNDYKRFIKDFANEYKTTMTPEKFAPLSAGFQAKNGKLLELKYLDALDQNIFKSVLWKAKFARSKAQADALKRNDKNPDKIPVPELLIRLLIGNVNGEWKVFAVFFN